MAGPDRTDNVSMALSPNTDSPCRYLASCVTQSYVTGVTLFDDFSDDYCQIVTIDGIWAARTCPLQAVSDIERDFISLRNRVLGDSAQFRHANRINYGAEPNPRSR